MKIIQSLVNRWYTGSRSPRVSLHYCFIGGVTFPQGEGSAVIHCKKNDLLYKNITVCVTALPGSVPFSWWF